MKIAHFAQCLVLGQDEGGGFDALAAECRGLAHEAVDDAGVVLGEHGGHPVPFGGKIEEGEEVILLVHGPLAGAVVDIDGGYFVFVRVGADAEIFKGKGLVIVQLVLCIGLHGVAVEHHIADVHIFRCQCHVVAIGCRAHGEEKPSAHDKVSYLVGHSQFQLADFGVAQFVGCGLLGTNIFDIPLLVAVVPPEFAVLASEVLVMEVQPVVGGKHSGNDFLVVNHVVGYFGVGEDKGHGIVPRQFVFG